MTLFAAVFLVVYIVVVVAVVYLPKCNSAKPQFMRVPLVFRVILCFPPYFLRVVVLAVLLVIH